MVQENLWQEEQVATGEFVSHLQIYAIFIEYFIIKIVLKAVY